MKNQHAQGRRGGDFVLLTPTEVENELPFQLVGAGYDFYQYPIDRPFGFPSFQWIQTVKGAGDLEVNGKQHTVKQSEGMLLYPNEPHSYHGDHWYVNWITFSGNIVLNMLHYVGMTETGVYQLSHPGTVEVFIRRALRILKSADPLQRMDGSAIVYSLLLNFLKYSARDGEISQSATMKRLEPALTLIEREMNRPLSLEDLADSVGISPQYFCELFKLIVGRRPMEYLNQRRVDRAKEIMLHDPHAKIHDIALSVGFHSDSYFGMLFRRFEGISPREYRGHS